MNVALLKKARGLILEHPRQVNVAGWFTNRDGLGRHAGGCGTAACVAGFIVFAVEKENRASITLEEMRESVLWHDTADEAKLRADLTKDQADRLFYHACWPRKFRAALAAAKTMKDYAGVVAQRVDYFIKTKGK